MRVPRRPLSIGFVAQPTNRSPVGFEAQTKKPSRWFWGPNHQTRVACFEAQTGKASTTLVLRVNQKNRPPVLRQNREKPSPPVLRPNWQKPSECFWGQTTHKPSTLVLRLNQETRASSLHVPGANHTRRHPTSRPSTHRVPDLYGHPQSSALGLLILPWSSSLHAMPHLPPAHHETSKHDSPNETKIKEKQNETISDSISNLAKSMTRHNQTKELTTWFLSLC
jgi:hypothetical protein